MVPVWTVFASLLLLVVVASMRRARTARLARLRASWGTATERPRRLDAMAASHSARIVSWSAGGSLDARTWADLDLDAVFAAIDRTHSTLGQHALYHRLRTAPVGDHLEAFEALVRRMSLDSAARERAQVALARLQDPLGYDIWWLAAAGAVERRSWYVVFPILTSLTIVLAAAAPFWSAGLMPLIAVLLVNLAARFATDYHVGTVARGFRQSAPLIATAESLRFLSGEDIDPIVGPLRTDVPVLARLKLISRWANGDPLMLAVGSDPVTSALSDVVVAAYEYLNLVLLLDATGVYFAVRDLSRHGAALVRVTASVGDVDAAISVASYRAGRDDWTTPAGSVVDAVIEMTDLRHPLIDGAVPNSIALRPGSGLLVTGSNMSGKSTFLRTVGVNAIMAQTINTCLARDYRAPVLRVRSCIGRTDDLVTAKSYYVAEVEALLDLVHASDASLPHLFLLDELFRGTNAVERIAAGQAVLQQLLGPSGTRKPHLVVAATHDAELVDLVADTFEACHFGDAIGGDGLIFDHRLKRGPATTRNAIALLRLHGAPDALLAQAAATAEVLDRQRGTTLVARR